MASQFLPNGTRYAEFSKPFTVGRCALFFIGIFWGWMVGSPLLAQTPSPPPVIPDGPAAETVLETLWRNNLYAVANDACQAQVDLLPVGSDSRIRWQCWLIRGLASEAIDLEDRSTPDIEKAKSNWEQIETIHQEAQAVAPPPWRNLWIRWQYLHAIHLRAQGAMARYLANPLDNAARDTALAAIRELDRGAELLQKSIAEQVASSSASSTVQARKQIREMQELSTETALLRCEALALRGQAYPGQSADAIAAGTEMEQFAIEAAGKIAPDWSGRAKLDLTLAVSKWLQGNRTEALQRAQGLLQSDDSRVRIRALDLVVQAALQASDRELAAGTLKEFQSLEATPEFALAQMRLALFDLPADANAPSLRQQAMSQLLAARDAIGERFGGYWQRRAEALLISVTASGGSDTMRNGNEVSELVRIEVRQLIAAKRIDEAVNKLVQQAAWLKREQRPDVALQFALQAAAIRQKEMNWLDAGELFQQAAIDFSDEKDASAAHLMAIYCMTQAVRNVPTDTSLWNKLDDLFIQQLQVFPADPASLQAAQQFAQSANYRRIWQTAADKMRSHITHVSFSHELVWLIVELEMRGLAWQYLDNDPRTLETAQNNLAAWHAWTDKVDKDATNDHLRKLGAFAQVVIRKLLPEALSLAMDKDANVESFSSLWEKTQVQPAEAGFSWKEAWQVVTNAKREITETRGLSRNTITALTKVLEGLGDETGENSADDAKPKTKNSSAALSPSVALWWATEVILEQLELLSPSERSNVREVMEELSRLLTIASQQASWRVAPQDKLNLLRWRLGVFGKDRQAFLVQLDDQIKKQPRVPVWQRTKALLLETGDADELEQALGIYRRLAAGAKSGSDEWLRARYRSALCLLWLKKVEDASQAAEVILLTHPPTETLWKKRLEALKSRP